MKKIIMFLGLSLLIAMSARMAGAEEFPKFSSEDLGGKAVANSIFACNKLTVANFWTIWCPPCIREMPDLGKLGRDMPAGTQLIGIAPDVEYPRRTVKRSQSSAMRRPIFSISFPAMI
jgi:thiol-disulfide isomerase/thioredoxin